MRSLLHSTAGTGTARSACPLGDHLQGLVTCVPFLFLSCLHHENLKNPKSSRNTNALGLRNLEHFCCLRSDFLKYMVIFVISKLE